jgi:hypothetical protein
MSTAAFFIDQAQRHAAPACVLTAFVISIAYVHRPRAKAFIYSLPVPFSCAYLATGLPINATHVTGLILVAGYNWLVYGLMRAKVPVALAIIVAAGTYFGGAMLLRPLAGISVWWVAGAALAGWLLALMAYRPRVEPGHRSRTAWWVKAPLIFAIAMGVYNATDLLAGGVGMFPYAGIFASYESRHSLRTLAGQFTINALGLLGCLLTIHLAEGRVPAPWPLLLGWIPVVVWAGTVRALKLGVSSGAERAVMTRPDEQGG